MKKMIQCQYCPFQSASFSEAVEHFEVEHRNNGEYIVYEMARYMAKAIKE